MTITTQVRSEAAINSARPVDMKFEVTAIPVSDVDRAKRFYGNLGWRLDADFVVGDTFRGVQFTPPGSAASIHFGKGVTPAAPGSASGLFLVVSDIEAARAELVSRGVDVSEIFHLAGPGHPPIPGLDPERRSYFSYATFKDPDGNTWLLQEVTARFPGRVDANQTVFASVADLATALRRAEAAHGEHEKRTAAGAMQTGRTGTPNTWRRSRPARSCRSSARRRLVDRESNRQAQRRHRACEAGDVRTKATDREHRFGKCRPPSPPSCQRRGSAAQLGMFAAAAVLCSSIAPGYAQDRSEQERKADIGFFEIDKDITLRRMVVHNPGPKGTVLFLHGFPETLYAWKDISLALADDYEVHAFDWPGYGFSSRPTVDRFSYAPKDYARVLENT